MTTDPFETFWQTYPNKKAIARARTAFANALKKTDFETLMAGLEAYKANKESWRAWLHPASWLNGECWADEWEIAPVQPAAFRSYDTWSEKDKRDCADTVTSKGTETATGAYGYTHGQIARLRADGYLRPVQVA